MDGKTQLFRGGFYNHMDDDEHGNMQGIIIL